MKNILTLFVFAIYCPVFFAQDKLTTELKTLTENKEYDKIISQYTSKAKDCSAKALYYIGQAYYMKEDDNNCIKWMDASIEKDPKDAAPYFIKASTLNYMKKFNDAIKVFQQAIDLNPTDATFYSGLGDSYYNLDKLEPALQAYKKATEQKNESLTRPYAMIALIYSGLKDNDKALEAFYVAKQNWIKHRVHT